MMNAKLIFFTLFMMFLVAAIPYVWVKTYFFFKEKSRKFKLQEEEDRITIAKKRQEELNLLTESTFSPISDYDRNWKKAETEYNKAMNQVPVDSSKIDDEKKYQRTEDDPEWLRASEREVR